MLETLLKEYYNNECIFSTNEYELYYQIIYNPRKYFFIHNTTQINALIVLKSNIISFHFIADKLLESISQTNLVTNRSIICKWLVCSEQGGIYLYEAIAEEKNIKYKGMKNMFIIINSLNGTISFGPGHIKNKQYSETMNEILNSYRSLEVSNWNVRFKQVVQQIYE